MYVHVCPCNFVKLVGHFKPFNPGDRLQAILFESLPCQGTLTMPDGAVYEGQFKNGKKHGVAKYTYANGAVYEGEYKEAPPRPSVGEFSHGKKAGQLRSPGRELMHQLKKTILKDHDI
eukprot:Skav232752  [mRNA]  locus=scaffold757:53535:56483:+ [translate_table: standard]